MMSAKESKLAILSMEMIEAGIGIPEWLLDAIGKGRRLMILHPTEASRKQAITKLHSMMDGGLSLIHISEPTRPY